MMDRLGKRPVVVFSALATIVSFSLFGVAYHHDSEPLGPDHTGSTTSAVLFVLCVSGFGMADLTAQSAMKAAIGNSYPGQSHLVGAAYGHYMVGS
jgi:MFS family permease